MSAKGRSRARIAPERDSAEGSPTTTKTSRPVALLLNIAHAPGNGGGQGLGGAEDGDAIQVEIAGSGEPSAELQAVLVLSLAGGAWILIG